MTQSKELFVDNFAGGGGASTGIEIAIGRNVDIAINHDPDAIAMHKANHPDTKHYCEDVWEVNPIDACEGTPVALAWFSPDCKHFSRAKGGKPVDKNIRGLAWVAIKWALLVRPRVIMLENVTEIQTWCPLGEDNKPIKERIGETFNGFILILSTGLPKEHPAFKECCEALNLSVDSKEADIFSNGLGYEIEYREMKSCDYGAPTSRNRFYMVARCDGKPIIFPKPTHAPKESESVIKGICKPYHSAAECIDWTIPAQSIFERDKPLAENTLKRIARGIQKFVIDNPEPFIVNYKFENPPQNINEPLTTVTSVNNHYLVTPSIIPIGYGERKGQQPRVNNIEEPLSTIVSSGKHYLAAPTLVQYHGEQSEKEVRGQELNKPLMTIDGSGRYALSVAHIMKNYGGNYKGAGSSAEKPLDTVTAKDHNSLVTAHVMKYYGGNYEGAGGDVKEPLHTITAEPKHYLVTSHVLTMRNNMDGQKADEPLTTISCSGAHHAEVETFLEKYSGINQNLTHVTINGDEYIITDIKMRMLQPRELFNANGFPCDYIIERDYMGKVYPKSKQVNRCGNAVTPPVATALVRANLPEYCRKD